MPTFKFLLQGLDSTKDHISAIEYLMQLEDIEEIFISVAFARTGGINLLEKILSKFSEKIRIFVGIRNGVTSVQALFCLIKNGIYPIVVDTASPSFIFHPKVFLAYSASKARLMIGSANLTEGGLAKNIEASSIVDLDLSFEDDKNHLVNVLSSFEKLLNTYPENVFSVLNRKHAYKLFNEGRLIDERIVSRPNISGKRKKSDSDDIGKMVLSTRKIKSRPLKKTKKPKTTILPNATGYKNEWILLWESKPLTERDLNIPSGGTTHATGSMLFKKGNMHDIDQRHHFRDEIFTNLNWEFDSDPRYKHLERATGRFELIIKGISYGVYNLKLSHNSRTNTRSYEQRNSMTQIHWGAIKKIIAERVLLGCTLRLYQPFSKNDFFIIEIE